MVRCSGAGRVALRLKSCSRCKSGPSMTRQAIKVNLNIYWLLELAIERAHLEDFRTLMQEMISAANAEVGTLNYEWNISADQTACHVYVRYRDAAAVMAHMHAFGSRYSTRFLALATITRMTVYGAADAKVKQALAPYAPVYFMPLGGFAR
jgi:quinol monooxygenase YgiN